MNLNSLKLGYNWLHIWGVMIVFRFSAAEVARKLIKPKHIFASPEKKLNYKNPRRFIYRFEQTPFV